MILFGLLGYFSVKFFMWIVEHKIENKQKKLKSISASNLCGKIVQRKFILKFVGRKNCWSRWRMQKK